MEEQLKAEKPGFTSAMPKNKLLVVLLTGKSDLFRAKQALVFATNVMRVGVIDDVRFLFFGPAVELLDSDDPDSREISELTRDLRERNVIVSACISNLKHFDLVEQAREQDVIAEGAAILVSELVAEGFQVITF